MYSQKGGQSVFKMTELKEKLDAEVKLGEMDPEAENSMI